MFLLCLPKRTANSHRRAGNSSEIEILKHRCHERSLQPRGWRDRLPQRSLVQTGRTASHQAPVAVGSAESQGRRSPWVPPCLFIAKRDRPIKWPRSARASIGLSPSVEIGPFRLHLKKSSGRGTHWACATRNSSPKFRPRPVRCGWVSHERYYRERYNFRIGLPRDLGYQGCGPLPRRLALALVPHSRRQSSWGSRHSPRSRWSACADPARRNRPMVAGTGARSRPSRCNPLIRSNHPESTPAPLQEIV